MVASNNPLLRAVMRAELSLQGVAPWSWAAQVSAFLRRIQVDAVLQAEGDQSVLVSSFEAAWERFYRASRERQCAGNPRAADVLNRQRVGYASWFRTAGLLSPALPLPGYLCLDAPLSRTLLTTFARFRLGVHTLAVCMARRRRVPYEDRVCPHCLTAGRGLHVQDEFHCLFQCVATQPVRQRVIFQALPTGFEVQDNESEAAAVDRSMRTLMRAPAVRVLVSYVVCCLDAS